MKMRFDASQVRKCCFVPSVVIALIILFCGMVAAHAHALAGQRLFPSTLNFDDPGIGAELPLTFSHFHHDGVNQNDFSLSVTKPITPDFSLTAGTDYSSLTGAGPSDVHGWGNVELGAVWQVYLDAATESIASFSINRSFEHTGSRAVRDGFSVWTPELDFGKGFGNLHASWARPLAVSGALAVELPNDDNIPRMLDWALSLQYSIPYLQDFVKYEGIKAPFKDMIPIIELPMQTCLDRGCRGQTTGYIAPGIIWVGHHVQWGFEFLVPVNDRSGNSIGILLGLDFYLDDIAPHGFGAPLFD